jgi:hypothetical protein
MTERRSNLEAVAARFGGTFVPGLWDGAQVEFRVDGARAQLAYFTGRRGYSPFTELRFDRVPPGCLRIRPEGVFASLRKLFGAQDIQIGEGRFDGSFTIQGSPERWVREMLDQGARQRITALASLGNSFLGATAVSIEAGPSGVAITCGQNLVDDARSLQAFLDHGMALFERLRGLPSEGMQILASAEGSPRGACPVCANPLDDEARPCPNCATPHHADCWEYFGGCAIYGCGHARGRSH